MSSYNKLNELYSQYVQTNSSTAFTEIAEMMPRLVKATYRGYDKSPENTLEKDKLFGDVTTNFLLTLSKKEIRSVKPSTLLHTYVYNAVVDKHRAFRRNIVELKREDFWKNVAASQSDKEQSIALNRDLKAELERAIDENVENPIDKDIFKRHYLEREPLKELAAEYGKGESAVKMRMSRLKDKLVEFPVFRELYETSNTITRGVSR